jgi:hypothetical protein
MRAVTTVLLAASACAVCLHGYRRGRLITSALLGAGLLTVVWLLVGVAVSSDWRDADGWVDCYPRCTRLQDAIAVLFILTPIAVGLLVTVALTAFLVERRRRSAR